MWTITNRRGQYPPKLWTAAGWNGNWIDWHWLQCPEAVRRTWEHQICKAKSSVPEAAPGGCHRGEGEKKLKCPPRQIPDIHIPKRVKQSQWRIGILEDNVILQKGKGNTWKHTVSRWQGRKFKNKKMRRHSEGLYTNTSYIESKQKATSKEVKSKRTQTQMGFI